MNSAGATVVGLVWLATVAPLSAQQWSTLFGVILDSSSATVPDAMVSVVNEDTGFRRVMQSRTDGVYAIASLQPGTYKVTVRKDGFHTVVRFGVRLNAAQSARLDFQLVVGSVQETITVEGGEVRWIDRSDASVGTVISGDDAENLPLNGHGLLSLIEFAPTAIVTPATRGESGQFSVDGQRPNTNYFTVDGVSANTGVSGGGLPAQSTGGALPGMSAFGSLHNLISLEGLQEMRVQVSTTVPQFGRLPGAQVSLASRSGANDFHGSLFDSFRPQLLTAADWFASGLNDGNSSVLFNDVGASLGGPILRNRTFFFISYEDLTLQQGFAWRDVVPSISSAHLPAWAQSVLSLYPAPSGPDLGNGLAEWNAWSNHPSHLQVGSLRIDQAITSHLTAFGRYNISPSSSDFGSAQISHLNLRSQSLTLGTDWLVGPRTVLGLRANASTAGLSSAWTQADPPAQACPLQPLTSYFLNTAGSCNSLVRFSIGGVSQVIYGNEGEQQQSQLQLVGTASLNRGSHSIQVGSDYLQLNPVRLDANSSLSILANSVAGAGYSSGLWIARSGPQDNRAKVQEASVFAQDTWRVTRRLTALYGLRWEFSPALMSTPTTNFLNPQTGVINTAQAPIWRTTYKDFAPRLGLAYRLDSTGRTVVRAGLGMYYDSSLSIATDLINGGPLTLSQYGSARIAPFDSLLTFGFTPDLELPLVKQWSATLEHAFGDFDTVSIGYVGSTGRQLIRREMGGLGSSPDIWVALTTNDGFSDYEALHVQYRRRLTRGLQAMATYTWSHSLDDGSSDSGLYWAGSGQTYWSNAPLALNDERGPSDFDVRHSVSAAFTYELPHGRTGALARFTNGWTVDGIFLARTGFPIDVLDTGQFMGLTLANAFRPDLVSGQPVWIGDTAAPGGRRLNPAAFSAAPAYAQGTLGRNAIAGFGMSQVDLALRREFRMRETSWMELRVETFDALNHPNFADPVNFLASPLFGYSPSMLNVMLGSGSPGSGLAPMFQSGGARSVQLTLRFRF